MLEKWDWQGKKKKRGINTKKKKKNFYICSGTLISASCFFSAYRSYIYVLFIIFM
jgi:hypothetical protein